MEIKLPEISEVELAKIKKEKLKDILSDEEINAIIREHNFTKEDIEKNLYHFVQYLNLRCVYYFQVLNSNLRYSFLM